MVVYRVLMKLYVNWIMDLKVIFVWVIRMIGINEETIFILVLKENYFVIYRNFKGKIGIVCNVKCMGFLFFILLKLEVFFSDLLFIWL